jgi:hypothetical protein
LFDDDERTENFRWNVYTREITVWDINVDVDKEFDVVGFALECVGTDIRELCEP